MEKIKVKLIIDMFPFKKGEVIEVTLRQYYKMFLLGYTEGFENENENF